MKNILKSFFALTMLLFSLSVSANQTDIYGDSNLSLNIYNDSYRAKLDEKLDVFYERTGLNTDVVILWKWDDCYLNPDFDSCIQQRENYTSDLIIILSMKSDVKKIWDIRTLVKWAYNKIITPELLTKKHDEALERFEKNNFIDGLIWYLDWLEVDIENACDAYWIEWICNAPELERNYYAYVNKIKHNELLEKVYLWLFLLLIIWSIFFYLFYYRKQLILLDEEINFYVLSLWDDETEKLKDLKEKLKRLKLSIDNNLVEMNKNILNWKKFHLEMKQRFDEIKLQADIEEDQLEEIEWKKEVNK